MCIRDSFGEDSQPKPISRSLLLTARNTGKRNRKYKSLQKTDPTGIALLEASIAYMKRGFVILASKVRDQLEKIVEKLLPPNAILPKTRIIKRGLEKAKSLLSAGVARWAPRILSWLKSKAYLMWLGISFAGVNA